MNLVNWNKGKEIDVSRETVNLENICVLLLEILKENIDLKESNIYLNKEISNVRNVFKNEHKNLEINLTAQIAKYLLDVADNLARISEASKKCNDVNVIIEGINMTEKELSKAINTLGIEKQAPLGKLYDPNLYEFGGTKEITDLDDNVIIEVIRDGYTFKDRIIRPSIVIVNSKKKLD